MQANLGLNYVSIAVIMPLILIAAVVLIIFIIKSKGSLWKRISLIVGSFFTLVGFTFVLLGIYFYLSPTFANSFRFYAYTAVAQNSNPFTESDGYIGRVLMIRDVMRTNGQLTVLNHPNPSAATAVSLFVPGQYIQGQLQDSVLSIPKDSPESVTKTSLWWALTRDLGRVNYPAAQ
ncbi:MAG: hypothetical protein WC693_03710 [Patescibacteria group bacterium]|jgi:hypothetical protein